MSTVDLSKDCHSTEVNAGMLISRGRRLVEGWGDVGGGHADIGDIRSTTTACLSHIPLRWMSIEQRCTYQASAGRRRYIKKPTARHASIDNLPVDMRSLL